MPLYIPCPQGDPACVFLSFETSLVNFLNDNRILWTLCSVFPVFSIDKASVPFYHALLKISEKGVKNRGSVPKLPYLFLFPIKKMNKSNSKKSLS